MAYNSTNHEYLVVWFGRDSGNWAITGDIYGQRLAGTTGAEIGTNDFRIGQQGLNYSLSPDDPVIAYNSINNEYLVVWRGAEIFGSQKVPQRGIFGQRLNGATGAEVGINDLLIGNGGSEHPPAVAKSELRRADAIKWLASEGRDDPQARATLLHIANDPTDPTMQALAAAMLAQLP